MRNMGGLRQYMPVTFVLMWIATLAIAGIPPFAGFFSKDEILGAVFARAQRLDARRRAPGSAFRAARVLYVAYVLGLAAAFLTAIYMTRMMLYTFHGPNRTGERGARASARGAVDHDGSARRARRAERVRRLAQPAGARCPLGPVGALEHWLEPVVGAGDAARHRRRAAEASHEHGVRRSIGAGGRDRGGRYRARRRAAQAGARSCRSAQAPPEHGFERVLARQVLRRRDLRRRRS